MNKKKVKTFQWTVSLIICAVLFMMVPDMIHEGRFLLGIATFLFSTPYGFLSLYKFNKWA